MIGVSKTGMVYYTLPIFSGLMAWYFLDEDLGVCVLFYSAIDSASGSRAVCQTRSTDKTGPCCS